MRRPSPLRFLDFQNEIQAIGGTYDQHNGAPEEDASNGTGRRQNVHTMRRPQYNVGISTSQITSRNTSPLWNRKTKIVCAIGPSCSSVEMIGALIDAGMNVARLNFSHGSHEFHATSVRNLRTAMKSRSDKQVALLMDTKGPEIRTGALTGHIPISLIEGDLITIGTNMEIVGTKEHIPCSYMDLSTSVQIGSVILIADGELTLHVEQVFESSICCRIMNSFVLEENKNMCLPGAKIRIPGITEKDIYDITHFALVHGVDIVSGSFVRTAENVRALRKCLGPRGSRIRVHAKIESLEALQNLDAILDEADGVHVSRGDLGMELEPQQVFVAQKMIIRAANLKGKPVVTSTQMLQSMTESSTPTFAECSDVANAVVDGTDAVMLSAETAKGKFPIEAVQTMSKICMAAEGCLDYCTIYRHMRTNTPKPIRVVESVASSAVEAAIDINAKAIIVFTETGYSARKVAKYRPQAPILVVTSSETVAHQMEGLSRGVTCLLVGSMMGTDALLVEAIAFAKSRKWVITGDVVVAIQGGQEGIAGNTNIVRVIQVASNGFMSPFNNLPVIEMNSP